MKVLSPEDYLNGNEIKIQSISSMPFDAHSHDFLEIAYISKGTAVNICDNQKISLSAGSYVIFDYFTIHQIVNKSMDIEGFNCLFLPYFLDSALANCKSFHGMLSALMIPCINHKNCFFFHDTDGQILDLILHIQKEMDEKQVGYREIAKTYLTQLLILSIRAFQANTENAIHNPLLEDIIHFLQKNYSQKDLLRLVSNEFNYSPTYISVLFQKNLGIHFNEYLRQLRIRNACQLLTKSDMSIEEVSFAVGYHDVYSFRANFKAQMQLTPMQYRKSRV